jgi:hypothetical protein
LASKRDCRGQAGTRRRRPDEDPTPTGSSSGFVGFRRVRSSGFVGCRRVSSGFVGLVGPGPLTLGQSSFDPSVFRRVFVGSSSGLRRYSSGLRRVFVGSPRLDCGSRVSMPNGSSRAKAGLTQGQRAGPDEADEIRRNPPRGQPDETRREPAEDTFGTENRLPGQSWLDPGSKGRTRRTRRNPTNGPDEIRRNPTKSDEIRRNPTKSDEIRRNPTKSDEIRRKVPPAKA